jgi:hypothetical protein
MLPLPEHVNRGRKKNPPPLRSGGAHIYRHIMSNPYLKCKHRLAFYS